MALAVVAAMATLAAAESRAEHRTLVAVGASPTILKRVAAVNAGLLALLGGLLAVPAGLLPLTAIFLASPAVVPLVIPWAAIAAGAVVVPALAAAGAATLSRTPTGPLHLRAR